jgi:NitT/TauT family transport system ATP-binding protein
MRQRVALARALATEPDVLLMDEPFAALDAQTRDLLHDELERIWQETRRTIVFVTHNVREAVRLGDRVALLTFRPGQVKREYEVCLPRPRQLEDVHVAGLAREILDDLREEINRSLESEYREAECGHEASA